MVLLAQTTAHAQTGSEAITRLLAAVGSEDELRNFVLAYLAGFAAAAIWASWRAWRRLRADVRGLRR
jgi:hypothetical protein